MSDYFKMGVKAPVVLAQEPLNRYICVPATPHPLPTITFVIPGPITLERSAEEHQTIPALYLDYHMVDIAGPVTIYEFDRWRAEVV